MKQGKYEVSRPKRRHHGAGGKGIALMLALALAVGGVIGGTLAWLTDTTQKVENTFTTSDIEITLAETAKDFKMVPGYTITKDPKVTVKAGSEKCYLFVKVEASENLGTYITYGMAEGWTQLTDGTTAITGVFYRVVDAGTADQTFSVLAGDQVAVKDTVTKEQMAAAETSAPTLTFTAYASQFNKNATETFTAIEAWNQVNPSTDS